jgi:uncharacterized membrane protein
VVATITTYGVYVFVHALGAIVWIGGGITINVLMTLASRAKDPAVLGALTKHVSWVGNRVFAPASLLLFLFGSLAVEQGDWSYDAWWVRLGVAGWVAAFVVSFGFLAPESARIGRLAAAEGPSPAVAARVRRLTLVSRLVLVVLVAVVFVMATKPG